MEIQEIKKRLSIHTVLKHYGLQPDRNNMLKCPFHVDDTASMKIYLQTNTFNCFGCGKNGDTIEFCTLKEGNKHKGILKAADLCGLSAEASAKAEEMQTINNKPKQPKQNHTDVSTESAKAEKVETLTMSYWKSVTTPGSSTTGASLMKQIQKSALMLVY